MATYGYTFQSGDGVTPTRLNDARTISNIVNADISASAAIAYSKLNLASSVTVADLVAAAANALVPVGAVQPFARSTAPTGWLAANGDTIGGASSNATHAAAGYEALFTALWDNWSNTDLPILTSGGAASTRGASASADFSANKRLPLPDLRGIFVRGSGSQDINGITYNKAFATKEQDQMQTISGSFRAYSNNSARSGAFTAGTLHSSNNFGSGAFANDRTFNFSSADSTGARTGTETRPANIALLYCIKF